jgi:hypothetical protein
MAKVVCSKCRMTGISKCPYCRNVFSDNQMDTLLSYGIKTKIIDEGGPKYLQIRLEIYKDKTPEETLESAIDRLVCVKDQSGNSKYTKYPTIKEFLCHHKWVFAPGEHSDIGCGHEIYDHI